MFSCEYCKILKNSSFYRTLLMAASVLFNQDASLKNSNVMKKRLQHRCFPVKSAKVLRTPFFTGHLWWLLLNKSRRSLWFIVRRSDALVIWHKPILVIHMLNLLTKSHFTFKLYCGL